MKKTITSFSAIIFVIITSAFANPSEGLKVTYSVSADDSSQIELTLNQDFTFTYQDLSNSDHPINVEGTYSVNGSHIDLNSNTETSFHSKWKISENGERVKSRKGLTFYSLCKTVE